MRLSAAAPACVALAFAAFAAPSLHAQTPGEASRPVPAAARLTGRVADAADQPLPGATVRVQAETGRARVAVSGLDGRFRIDGLAPGRYRVAVSYVGYADASQALDLVAGAAAEVAFRLDEADVVSGGEVVVEGVHRATVGVSPVTASTLTARDLAQLPDVKDLPASLASQPSVTFHSENGNGFGYTYLRLRGFDERRVAVSLNGQPMNDPEDHAVYWINLMDLQGAITDVQIQRGAGAALYGSAGVGGAINVVADPYRARRYAAFETGYGSYATRRLTAEASSGLVGGRWIAFARASHLTSQGYREHAWAEMTRLFGGVTRLGARSRLTLQAFGGPQRDALAYYGIEKADNDVDSLRVKNYGAISGDLERLNQPFAELRHELQIRPDLRLETNAYATFSEGYFDFGASWRSADYLRLPAGFGGLSAAERQQPLYEVSAANPTFRAFVRNRRAGVLPRLVYTPLGGAFSGSRFVVGADVLAHQSLHYGRVEGGTGLGGAPTGEAAAKAYEYRGGKAHAAVYGSALVRPSDLVAVQADLSIRHLRYRLHGEAYYGTDFAVPYTFVTPRLGVTLAPERPVRAYASVARVAREPRLKNFYDADEAATGAVPLFAPQGAGLDFSRPLVRPETGVNVEVGAAVERPAVRVAVNAYGLWMKDEIVASGGLDQFGVPRTGNAARTRHVGVEAEAAVRLAPGLVAEASATASDDRFVRFAEFDDNGAALDRRGQRIALMPAASVRGTLRYEPARQPFGARLDVQGAGVQPTTNAGTKDRAAVVDPYALVNVGAWWRLAAPGGALQLRLDVNNVLDARVLTFGNSGGFFPAAPRHAYVGLRYTVE